MSDSGTELPIAVVCNISPSPQKTRTNQVARHLCWGCFSRFGLFTSKL